MPFPASITTFNFRLVWSNLNNESRKSTYSFNSGSSRSLPTGLLVIGTPLITKSLIRISPDSWPIGRAWLLHNLIPLYAAGLWLAVNIAPGKFK